MTDGEIGWVAGIIEGEGYIATKGKSGAKIVVNMTDEDVIEKLRTVTGVGTITSCYSREGNKPCWRWGVYNKRDVKIVLEAIHPWMCERRSTRVQETLIHMTTETWPILHGTTSGYTSELRKGLSPCDECRRANTVANRAWRQKKKLQTSMLNYKEADE